MHVLALTQMRICVKKPFIQRNSLTSSKIFSFDFCKIAENVCFLRSCTHSKQW